MRRRCTWTFLAAAVVIVIAAAAMMVAGGTPSPVPTAVPPGPATLLWIEEINTHLLGHGVDAARIMADAGSGGGNAGTVPILDPERRTVKVGRLDRVVTNPGGRNAGERLLVVYRLYDYDVGLRSTTLLVPSDQLPLRLEPPAWASPAAGAGATGGGPWRLLPTRMLVGPSTGSTLAMTVDDEAVQLRVGDVWAFVRLADRDRPLILDAGVTASAASRQAGFEQHALLAALDAGRPLTMLRFRHLGTWWLEPTHPDPATVEGVGA